MEAKKILDLIESFVKSFNDKLYNENMFVEIFMNPSRSELMKLFASCDDMLRFIADPSSKKIYFFRGDYYHEHAYIRLSIHTPLIDCLVGVLSLGLNRKFEITLYELRMIQTKDWSWLDIYFNTDINDYIRKQMLI